MLNNHKQLVDTLSVGGNNSFIYEQLKYFEDQIKLHSETGKNIYKAPNYYAWLLMASESVLYRIRELLYFNNSDHNAFDEQYSKLLNKIFSSYRLLEKDKEDILFFAKTRHLLVHKGYPNQHVVPAEKAYNICSGYQFSKEDIQKHKEYLTNTKNFLEIKDRFYSTIRTVNKQENPVKQDFGFMSVEKINSDGDKNNENTI